MTAIHLSSASSFRPRVFGARPFRVDGELLALRFAADGGLWSVEEAGVLRHWDVAEGRQTMWHELADPAALWCFSSTAHYVAAGSDEVAIWETANGEALACWPQSSWVTALAFQAGGLLLASGHDDGRVRLWNYASSRLAGELHSPSQSSAVSALAFSGDGRILAVADENRHIFLWNVRNGELLGRLQGHSDRIATLAWLPDSRHLVSAGWDAAARLWDVESGRLVVYFHGIAGPIQTLAVARDGQHLAYADSVNNVCLVNRNSPCTLAARCLSDGEVRSLDFSPDGRRLAYVGADRVIHICPVDGGWWKVDGEEKSSTIHLPLATRTCLAVVSDGRRLASLSGSTSLRVWDTATTEAILNSEDAPQLRAFAASPDGRWFAGSLADEKRVGLWHADSGRRERLFDGFADAITLLAFSPDSRCLAAATSRSGEVRFWAVPSGELLPSANAIEGCDVEALAFHPNGQLLAVGGSDWLASDDGQGRVVLWDVSQRCPIAVLPGGGVSLAFHPCGRFLASAARSAVVLVWDVQTHRKHLELIGHLDAVTCVAYSPDGRFVASGGDDRTVRLWDADSGAALALVELDTQTKALAFAPDGRSLFTANGTTSCYQLDVTRMLTSES